MQSGSIRLFRIAGITVFLHFSWFFVAIYQITRPNAYHLKVFAVYEYLALFALVLMHEFGHALACRSVGGHAEQIVLWPLGGIAFVSPPPRAGAMLWSIAAGPLVNLVMVPVLEVLWLIAVHGGVMSDTVTLVFWIRRINLALLIFNLMPVYPLDGGQILRALLWFPLGRTRSLQIATGIGLLGGGGLALYAWRIGSMWIGVMAFFLLSQAWAGWQHATVLAAEDREAIRLRAEAGERPML
jgi:Zn-dependent protease